MNRIFTNRKGFTLLELLVVVLIIGILAGIALPQYKMVVAKSKFATVKNITKDLFLSAERYYMLHGDFIKNVSELDVTYKINTSTNNETQIGLNLSNGTSCTIFRKERKVACGRTIFKIYVAYYQYIVNPRTYRQCISFSTDSNDIGNRLCQNETGKKYSLNPSGYYTSYFY